MRNYSCDICFKLFTSNGDVKRHVLLVHERLENIKCEACDKTFVFQKDLRRHVKTVHLKIRSIKCHLCNKELAGGDAHLKKHMRRIHEGNEKLFKCDHCQKDFSHKSTMDIHRRRVHLNERLNPCEECNLTFATENILLKHRNICPINVKERRIYPCLQCSKSFTELKILIKHEITIHEMRKVQASNDIN